MNTQTLTHAIKTTLIKNVLDTATADPLYMYYSRPTDFENSIIPDVIDSIEGDNEIKSNMMSLKRIQRSDMNPACRKIEWVSGTVYDQYESNADLSDKNFYVVLDNRQVYKCLNNNGGAASTVVPTDNIQTLADGYSWHLMFIIPLGLDRKFSFQDFIPIYEDKLVINSATLGSITRINVNDSGSNYAVSYDDAELSYIPIFVNGDGDTNQTGIVEITEINGEITDVTISDPGSNYRIPSGGKVIPV